METSGIGPIVAVGLLSLGGVLWAVLRNRRRDAGSASRGNRTERLDDHALSAKDRERFTERWHSTQAAFVDDPTATVSGAEALIEDVLRARGYPVSDFDQRGADISVAHPRFIEKFREARSLAAARQSGAARTEDLRLATIHYRALFEELVETTK